MNIIDRQKYTTEQKIQQYICTAKLQKSFTAQGALSRRVATGHSSVNELQVNQCESYAEDKGITPGLNVNQMESGVSYDVNNYVYDDSIPEHHLLSVFRTNQVDSSAGNRKGDT